MDEEYACEYPPREAGDVISVSPDIYIQIYVNICIDRGIYIYMYVFRHRYIDINIDLEIYSCCKHIFVHKYIYMNEHIYV